MRECCFFLFFVLAGCAVSNKLTVLAIEAFFVIAIFALVSFFQAVVSAMVNVLTNEEQGLGLQQPAGIGQRPRPMCNP